MSAEEQRVAAFLVALRESEEQFPHVTSGGYVETLDGTGATVDGWWTVEQLAHALNAATPPAPRRPSWRDDPRWWSGALTGALVLWLGDLIWGMLT